MSRPTHKVVKRRIGGKKVCSKCKTSHPEVVRDAAGKSFRPKTCEKCGADLPTKLSFGKRSEATYYVETFDPGSGKTTSKSYPSKEQAEQAVRDLEQNYSPDETQRAMIEKAVGLIRAMPHGLDIDTLTDRLIAQLGGDPVPRSLRPIPIDEAINAIVAEMKRRDGVSDLHCDDVRRVVNAFVAITGIGSLAEATHEHVKTFAMKLAEGGWIRDGKAARTIGSYSRKRYLAVLRAFAVRAADNHWMSPRLTDNSKAARKLWRQATGPVNNEYLADADFEKILDAAGHDRWLRALLLLGLNTGARLADVLRLTWRDVDWDAATVTVANSKGNAHAAVKKSPVIPLHPVVLDVLRDIYHNPVIRFQRHARPVDRVVRAGPDGTPAADENILPIRGFSSARAEVSKWVSELVVKAGLVDANKKPRFSFHSLRGKAATDLSRAGASLKDVMSLTGHATATVTLKHYVAEADTDRLRALVGGMAGLRLTKESA